MSKRETPITRWYWGQRGGTLIEEFRAVETSATQSRRLLDGVVVLGGEHRIARMDEVPLEGKDVLIIQTKIGRLGMSVMGQTLFSMELIRPFRPRSIESVALCEKDDTTLRPLLEAHPGCKVVLWPKELHLANGLRDVG